jgi:hypothetical protein
LALPLRKALALPSSTALSTRSCTTTLARRAWPSPTASSVGRCTTVKGRAASTLTDGLLFNSGRCGVDQPDLRNVGHPNLGGNRVVRLDALVSSDSPQECAPASESCLTRSTAGSLARALSGSWVPSAILLPTLRQLLTATRPSPAARVLLPLQLHDQPALGHLQPVLDP